jgi:hypothetical protein
LNYHGPWFEGLAGSGMKLPIAYRRRGVAPPDVTDKGGQAGSFFIIFLLISSNLLFARHFRFHSFV